MPKVSVIVPVYKAERTLSRCVDSILAQTYTDFEVLLINDGSPDKSGILCDEYARKDSRVRVFHKPNGGVSSARNLGLDNARGEWISFVDADDLITKDFLFHFSLFFASPCVHLIIQNLKKEDEKGNVTIEYTNIEKDQLSINELYSVNSGDNIHFQGYVCNKCFNHSIISNNKIVFDEDLSLYEDEKFIITYCSKILNNSIAYSNYPGYHYYSSSSNFGNKYKYILESQFKIYESVKLFNIPPYFFLERFLWDTLYLWKSNNHQLPNRIVNQLVNIVGRDIALLNGKRKYLFKIISHSKNTTIWKVVLNLYFLMIKNKL